MTTLNTITTPDFIIESCLKLWRDRILSDHKRKDLTAADLASLFQQQDLQKSFFKIIDRDCNGCLSLEEWTGCFSKLLDEANDTQLLNWFVEKFYIFCNAHETNYLNEKDFEHIVSDIEFGYRLASLISPKSRRIKTIQLITSLEIISSLSTDAKWLSWLKYQFTEAMNKNDRLDKNELHVTLDDFVQNFYFKEPFLAHRLFTYLDKDKSGYLSLREFINGLELIVNGSQEEKMEFLFKVFDVDGNGRIDFIELRMMLRCCLEESPSLDLEETVDDLSALLFKHLDKDDSGDISIDELKSAFKEHYDLYKSLSLSTSIWIKPKFVTKNQKETSLFHRFKHFITNKQATIIFWSAYILIHLICMVTAYVEYRNENILVRIARMFGNSLNFNCSLILVLVLRKHLTWLRIKGGNNLLPIDEFIEIHKLLGVIILIETLIHTIAHLINLYYVAMDKKFNYFEGLLTFKINSGFPTGVLELILLLIILFFAMSYVRKRGHFELFFMMHMLTIPWLIIMLFHGLKFWRWLLLPAFCYLIEKVLRYRKTRSNKFGDTFIIESYVLPSKVTHLVIRKPSKFHFKPGDYIYINVPIIAKYEWHPFSISSAPENSDFIWLHIKSAGNWTNKLYAYSQSSKFDQNNCSAMSTNVSQRSIVRLNMRTKMSKLINNSLSLSSIDINQNEQLNGNIKKAVSFVPQSNLLLEEEIIHNNREQIDISKISNKEVLFFNDTTESPLNAGMSVVPQSFKEPITQLRHKSILKIMSLNCNSIKSITDQSPINDKNDRPIESTPRSLTNINDIEESKSMTQQFKNRSKSLDNQMENSFYTSCIDQKNQHHAKSESSYQLESGQLKTRLDYFQTDNTTTVQDNSKNEADNYSKNNLVLSYENNLSNVIVVNDSDKVAKIEVNNDLPIVEFRHTKQTSHFNEDECDDACFLNIVDTSDDNQRNDVKQQSYHQTSILSTKAFNNLNKSVSSLYNRFKKQISTGNQIEPTKRDDALGYLKMYSKANRVNMNTIGTDDAWRLKVHIDGPYGTPSSEIFDSEHAVLIAAGIGITPFASILQSIMNKFRQARAKCPNCDHKLSDDLTLCSEKLTIKKVDFIWITRDQRSLEWFISILSQMEIEQKKNNESFLETHLYVTSAKRQSDLRSVSLQMTLDAIFSEEESSLIDGLRKRTHHGRPNWDIVLQNLIRKQKGKINVFYCGLPSLASVLQDKCKEYDLTFKKEIF